MVKIALDPAMYHSTLSVVEEVHKTAELGYEYLELSPRDDFFSWHRYPTAGAGEVKAVKDALAETGVRMQTLVPVYNWSSAREDERVAAVRSWRRLLEIATELECPIVNSELSGDPNDPQHCDASFRRSLDELLPVLERYGLGLNLEAHPYDFIERNDAAVDLVRGIDSPNVNYLFCAPHAFHLSNGVGDVRRMIDYAGDRLKQVHLADVFNHTINNGLRYIVNPPGADVRVHQHNEIGNGDVPWGEVFGALRSADFDGVATVCVFGWNERADEIHRRMLERVQQELAPTRT